MVALARSRASIGVGQDDRFTGAGVDVVQAGAQGDHQVITLGSSVGVVHLGSRAGAQHQVGVQGVARGSAVLKRLHAQLPVAVVVVAGLADYGPPPTVVRQGRLARTFVAQDRVGRGRVHGE